MFNSCHDMTAAMHNTVIPKVHEQLSTSPDGVLVPLALEVIFTYRLRVNFLIIKLQFTEFYIIILRIHVSC